MVAPITAPPANTPGDFAGNPVLFDQKKMEWYLWFQTACPQFSALATDLQAEILAAAEAAAAASATAAANAVLTSKVTGPASATANALAKFDGTTGKLVKVSGLVEDAAGNLALGGTPSAWNSTYRAIDVAGGSISGRTSTSNQVDVASNAYRDGPGNWLYKFTSPAVRFTADGSSGGYQWYTAPSGTEGNPITFTQAMTLGQYGDLTLWTPVQVATTQYITGGYAGTGYGARVGFRSNATSYAGAEILFERAVGVGNWTESGRFDLDGNFKAGTTSGTTNVFAKSAANDFVLQLVNGSASNPYGLRIDYSQVSGGSGQSFAYFSDSSAVRFQVLGNGNVQNINNSYGAISDLKLKDNIVDVSPKLAKLLQVRIVNYTLKADPNKTKLMGVIAQELEQISPGLIEETPDFEEVTRTREVTKTVPVTEQAPVLREQKTVEVVDGKAIVKTEWLEELADVPVVDHYPLFDDAGQPVLEMVTPEVPAVTDADGNVTQPAVAATYRQAMHSVPRMKEVTETETYTERVPTGTTTKSVKYSVFVPMLIKAMQEQQAQIDTLSGRLLALGAA